MPGKSDGRYGRGFTRENKRRKEEKGKKRELNEKTRNFLTRKIN